MFNLSQYYKRDRKRLKYIEEEFDTRIKCNLTYYNLIKIVILDNEIRSFQVYYSIAIFDIKINKLKELLHSYKFYSYTWMCM